MFDVPTDPVSAIISKLLRQLRDLRTISDYELADVSSYNRRQVSLAILLQFATTVGKELLENLEKFTPGESPDGCSCPTR